MRLFFFFSEDHTGKPTTLYREISRKSKRIVRTTPLKTAVMNKVNSSCNKFGVEVSFRKLMDNQKIKFSGEQKTDRNRTVSDSG